MITAAILARFLAAEPALALVRVDAALGSTPREQGAWMLVSPTRSLGTIGGGQLEFMAIDQARALLGGTTEPDADAATLSVPLGPEIGQCCGGRVGLSFTRLDDAARETLLTQARDDDAARPVVMLFGAGHVGLALAKAFALLPLRVIVVETRREALDAMPTDVETLLTPVPEDAVKSAPPGSAFLVLTHDHALDFLIVAQALARDDAAYVGMIGSKTKLATFRGWYAREIGDTRVDLQRLTCPIGGDRVKDKRPEVIAALAAAEVMTALAETKN